MKTTTLLQFIRLNTDAQISLLDRNGMLVDASQSETVKCRCYSLNDYFVEVYSICGIITGITPYRRSPAFLAYIRSRHLLNSQSIGEAA